MPMSDITREVMEKIGVLSESPTGWTKELRVVNWNGVGPRYDLREWSPGDRQVTRGITLSLQEIKALQELLVETEFPALLIGEATGESSELREETEPKAFSAATRAGKKAG